MPSLSLGFDIEGVVRDKHGEVVWGVDVAPDQRMEERLSTACTGFANDAEGVIRRYNDGAAVELGTVSPAYCLAYWLDQIRAALYYLGAPGLSRAHGDPERRKDVTLVWRDVVPLGPAKVRMAPPDVLISGCHPRYSCETMAPVMGPRPYAGYLLNYGAPVGCHLHFGDKNLVRMPPDELSLRIKAMVVKCLSFYAAQGNPGSMDRWRAFGVGMYRRPKFGVEWTDPGLCVAKNMLMLAAVMGDCRFLLTTAIGEIIAFLDKTPYEPVKEAILKSRKAAREAALLAHEAAVKLWGDATVDEDTCSFSVYKNIEAACRRAIQHGFPDNGRGWWYKNPNPHKHGLESGLERTRS